MGVRMKLVVQGAARGGAATVAVEMDDDGTVSAVGTMPAWMTVDDLVHFGSLMQRYVDTPTTPAPDPESGK